jgi:hypothetical protein
MDNWRQKIACKALRLLVMKVPLNFAYDSSCRVVSLKYILMQRSLIVKSSVKQSGLDVTNMLT